MVIFAFGFSHQIDKVDVWKRLRHSSCFHYLLNVPPVKVEGLSLSGTTSYKLSLLVTIANSVEDGTHWNYRSFLLSSNGPTLGNRKAFYVVALRLPTRLLGSGCYRILYMEYGEEK